EMLLHQPAEVGQMGQMPLAPEQLPPELVLERMDRTAQRRHGDAALLGGAGEIQSLARGEKVANLMQFHGPTSSAVSTQAPECAFPARAARTLDHLIRSTDFAWTGSAVAHCKVGKGALLSARRWAKSRARRAHHQWYG